MFGLMPNYTTVDSGTAVSPLTAGDKMKLALRYLDPYTFVFVAVRAGYDQAIDDKSEYGQGAEGYGKRYGADFADGLTNSIFVTGVYPALFHDDPRYFRQGSGGFFSRTTYAVSRIMITRKDSGARAFNYSEILGNLSSGAISTSYYPESERNAGGVFERAGIQLGFDAGFNLVREFYPDVMRKLFRKKSEK